MKKVKSIKAQTAEELADLPKLDSSVTIEWEMRSQLSGQIIRNFKAKKFTITELAKRSGTSRSRITRVLKGDTLGIGLEVLIKILVATGQKVQLKFLKAS